MPDPSCPTSRTIKPNLRTIVDVHDASIEKCDECGPRSPIGITAAAGGQNSKKQESPVPLNPMMHDNDSDDDAENKEDHGQLMAKDKIDEMAVMPPKPGAQTLYQTLEPDNPEPTTGLDAIADPHAVSVSDPIGVDAEQVQLGDMSAGNADKVEPSHTNFEKEKRELVNETSKTIGSRNVLGRTRNDVNYGPTTTENGYQPCASEQVRQEPASSRPTSVSWAECTTGDVDCNPTG